MNFPAHALLILCLSFQQSDFRKGVELSLANDHAGSESILSQVRPLPHQFNSYHYFRLVNVFRLNQKKNVLDRVHILENSLNVPERYAATTALMKSEALLWKDDLDDIARDMKKVRDRLEHGRAGKETRKVQDDIVARLDKLIKEKEEAAKGSGKSEGGEPKDGQAKNKAAKPLDETKVGNEGGTGAVDTARMRKLAEQWGRLPPREQARALQELTRGLSNRHREGIENYFRNIAQGKRK